MKTFLEYVADDILTKHGTNLARTAVVFPNKRAELFLNDYLARAAKRRQTATSNGIVPLWSPAYMTIGDLFRRHSPLHVPSNTILLVCKLYKVFVRHTGSTESLDRFFGWGQLLLNDFDDIDKNMADATRVFANLRDLHEYDTTDYLTDEQKAALHRFFTTFSGDNSSRLRERFLKLWSHMGDIYTDYRQTLRHEGLAYEGMVYRDVVETQLADSTAPLTTQYDTYLFVGLNMLHKAERQLLQHLKDEGKARFYWDFDHYYTPIGCTATVAHHEAGRYISQHLDRFPNELDSHDTAIYGNMARRGQQLTFISAPTDDAQARHVSQWLRQDRRYNDGRRTAIVMCDEALLPTVVHCLPPEVDKVNVTTGMPLAQSPLCSFVDCLLTLQLAGYSAKQQAFRLFHVKKVLTHPCTRLLTRHGHDLCNTLIDNHTYHPTAAELCTDEGLAVIFTRIDSNKGNERLLAWLTAIVRRMAVNSRGATAADALMEEALFKVYTQLNALRTMVAEGDLTVETLTLQRLIRQVLTTTTVPFHGEPAEGVQVMGVLETRNLDFDHLLILSCDEGNMPRHARDVSIVPHTLREYYGLTTADNDAAVYAYYFYRMIQRAGDVTIVYNNFTSDKRQAEMSRFMLQLMVESGMSIDRRTLHSQQQMRHYRPTPVVKTAAMLAQIERMSKTGTHIGEYYLSPSAINRYLRCPLQFYHCNIRGIKEPDAAEGEIDERLFGNIFHRAAEHVYAGQRLVTADFIDQRLKDRSWVESRVDAAIDYELLGNREAFTATRCGIAGRLNGTQLIKRAVIIRYIESLLKADRELTPFTILGVEHEVFAPLTISTPSGDERRVNIKGIIDRMDMVIDKESGRPRVRVVDYKTGGADLTKDKMASLAAVFDKDTDERRKPEYYRQAMLYALLLADDPGDVVRRVGSEVTFSPALLFIRHPKNDPTLVIDGKPITDIRTVADEFRQSMRQVLEEMFDPARPFAPTEKLETCKRCAFAKLCR